MVPTLILGALLGQAGCARATDEPGTPSPAQAPSPSATRGDPSTGPTGSPGEVAHRVVDEVTGADAGGTTGSGLVALPDDGAVETWLSQFSGEGIRADLREVVDAGRARLADDEALLGAVLSIGCESPRRWFLERDDGELRVRVLMPKRTVQCLVPVTTVAVLAVDEDEAGGVAGPA